MKPVLFGCAMFNWSETQRMVELAKALAQRGYPIVFLGDGKYARLLEGLPFQRVILPEDADWFTPARVEKMLDMGTYGNNYATAAEISRVVDAELAVIQNVQPGLIVTGYRMTLSASARIARVKLAWCLSAVVSGLYLEQEVASGVAALEKLSKQERKALPYEQVRAWYGDKLMLSRAMAGCATSQQWNLCLQKHGAAPLRRDMELFEGDLNLMSDARELFPQLCEDASHAFIGPIFNPEHFALPPQMEQALHAPSGRKKVLVSVGSGGKRTNLQAALQALLESDCEVYASTIGTMTAEEMAAYPDRFHFCEAFSLVEVARCCDAAIIQAGQGTLYAIALAGRPFVSLPSTFEQRHNIDNLLRHFACGIAVPTYAVTVPNLSGALHRILTEPSFAESAEALRQVLLPYAEDTARHAEQTAADLLEAQMV